jgi:hypothetical protein
MITADSIPDLDSWGWDDYWSAQDWIKWHKELKKKYGLSDANYRFIDAYGSGSFMEGLGAARFSYRTTDREFIRYAKENGFYNALFGGLAGLSAKVVSTAYSAGHSIVETGGNIVESGTGALQNAGQTVSNTVSVLKWIVPLLLIGLAYTIFKNPTKFLPYK